MRWIPDTLSCFGDSFIQFGAESVSQTYENQYTHEVMQSDDLMINSLSSLPEALRRKSFHIRYRFTHEFLLTRLCFESLIISGRAALSIRHSIIYIGCHDRLRGKIACTDLPLHQDLSMTEQVRIQTDLGV